jgi:hypothetical protein
VSYSHPKDSFSLRPACLHCHGDLEIELDCREMPDGPHLYLGRHRCPTCGRELALFGSRANREFVEFRLVDPFREWTMEEILNQEG